MIYQTLQEATKARGARKIEIIHLGLHPWEAVEMGLEVETVEVKKNKADERVRKPVADYVIGDATDTRSRWRHLGGVAADPSHRTERDDHAAVHRVARRARWPTHGVGKLIPPAEVLTAELDERIEAKVRDDADRAHPARGRSRRTGQGRDQEDREADRRCPGQGHQGELQGEARPRVARPHRGRGQEADFENLKPD